MIRLITGFYIVFTLAFSNSIFAAGIGTRASTLGIGFEYAHPVAPKLNARLNTNFLSLAKEQTQDDIDWDFDSSLNTFAAILDWHPTGGGFRVSGGVLLNQSEVNITALLLPNTDYEIGGETYTNRDFRIKGTLNFRPVAPYLGIGWGMSPNKGTGWAFSAELGVVYQGKPSIELQASGTASQAGSNVIIPVTEDALFIESLADQEKILTDEIDDFNIFPVLSLGVMYSF